MPFDFSSMDPIRHHVNRLTDQIILWFRPLTISRIMPRIPIREAYPIFKRKYKFIARIRTWLISILFHSIVPIYFISRSEDNKFTAIIISLDRFFDPNVVDLQTIGGPTQFFLLFSEQIPCFIGRNLSTIQANVEQTNILINRIFTDEMKNVVDLTFCPLRQSLVTTRFPYLLRQLFVNLCRCRTIYCRPRIY
jgi:hypothetical protein